MKRVSAVLAATIFVLATLVFTQRAFTQETDSLPVEEMKAIKSIPAMEAERLAKEPAVNRTDTGRLTAEALKEEHEIFATISTHYVMEDIEAPNVVKLPITSERSRIAILSSADKSLDVKLSDPTGEPMSIEKHTRKGSVEMGDSDTPASESNRKSNDTGGVMLVSERERLLPGNYTLRVRRAKSPVAVMVNEQGGPELQMWLSENGLDSGATTTLYAKLVNGESLIRGATLSAKMRSEPKAKPLKMAEVEPGTYAVSINQSKLKGTTTFIVAAEGLTGGGLKVLRHGSIDLITGESHAKLLGIGKEQLTDADLEVKVDLEVEAEGRYYLRGNLLGPNNEPIAWAQDASNLKPGRHTFTLRFAREIIKESGVSSNFKLTDVILMNTTAVPGVKASTRINDYSLTASLNSPPVEPEEIEAPPQPSPSSTPDKAEEVEPREQP